MRMKKITLYLISIAACLSLLNGCVTRTLPETPQPEEPVIIEDAEPVPVTRYGRYTLVELVPLDIQQDLLKQVVHVTLPKKINKRPVTVGDALRQILNDSGYRLCDKPAVIPLTQLPLPAAHHALGPLMLRDALNTLSGPGWQLLIHESKRQVCFTATDHIREEGGLHEI